MPKLQRQFKTGAVYSVEGVSERVRRLKYVGRGKIMGKEVLMFRAARKAKKRRDSN